VSDPVSNVALSNAIGFPMYFRCPPARVVRALLLSWLVLCGTAAAQDELSEDAADPVRLFNQGQDAHAKKNYELALEFYEEALKLRPEFPEAEYQRGSALVSLKRPAEAEGAYRRAMELRKDWAMPPAALGLLLARAGGREKEAETLLRQSLAIDAKGVTALAALAELRAREGDAAEAAELLKRATAVKADDAALWVSRAQAEAASKAHAAAALSLARALELEPGNHVARVRLAELYLDLGDDARASENLRALEAAVKTDVELAYMLAHAYGRAGRVEEARRIYDALPTEAKNSAEGRRLSAALEARCEDTPEARASLEKLVAREPQNAKALACLGNLFRTSDPSRSLDFYQRALAVEPRNADYATGYAAALLQLRRFNDAAALLQRIVRDAPDNYPAHANLAAAFYELKLYREAIVEYKWLGRARPDLAVIHYFIGSAHDHLGEYPEALAAYEAFLAGADAAANQLEIEKVNLRLPSLRGQIKRGGGSKQKKAQ
jgi:tetratricopeptide (TPR) repeat protein